MRSLFTESHVLYSSASKLQAIHFFSCRSGNGLEIWPKVGGHKSGAVFMACVRPLYACCYFILISSLGICLYSVSTQLLCTLTLFCKTLVMMVNTMRHRVKPTQWTHQPTQRAGVTQDEPRISWREFRSLLTGKERNQRQRTDRSQTQRQEDRQLQMPQATTNSRYSSILPHHFSVFAF